MKADQRPPRRPGWENERHPVARLLLAPLGWPVLFLPVTLLYYAVVLPVLAAAGLILLTARLRARKASRGRCASAWQSSR